MYNNDDLTDKFISEAMYDSKHEALNVGTRVARQDIAALKQQELIEVAL